MLNAKIEWSSLWILQFFLGIVLGLFLEVAGLDVVERRGHYGMSSRVQKQKEEGLLDILLV